jgi:hypothetical protein
MTLSYALVLLLVITIGIITLFALSTVIGNQVFASSNNDNDDGKGENQNDNNDVGSDGDGVLTKARPQQVLLLLFDTTVWDPIGIIIPMNETTTGYENKEHGFAFDFPADWQRVIPSTMGNQYNIEVAPPDPSSDSSVWSKCS